MMNNRDNYRYFKMWVCWVGLIGWAVGEAIQLQLLSVVSLVCTLVMLWLVERDQHVWELWERSEWEQSELRDIALLGGVGGEAPDEKELREALPSSSLAGGSEATAPAPGAFRAADRGSEATEGA